MFAVEFWLANVSAMRITAKNFRAIMSYFSAACKTDENHYHRSPSHFVDWSSMARPNPNPWWAAARTRNCPMLTGGGNWRILRCAAYQN